MKFYFPKTPKFVTWLYPKRIWAFSKAKKEIFLTFDDGPIPEVTPWVLDLLRESDAKATFFCIGDNIRKHPYLLQRILDEGHSIGNHTYHHVKGAQTSTAAYLEEVSAFNACVEKPPKLFRPPYGKITSRQAKVLQNKGYNIVMWDVISYDFDRSITQEKCLKNVVGSMKEGSVIVFHDSLKAEPHLRYTLPKVLEAIRKKGWQAKAIPQDV